LGVFLFVCSKNDEDNFVVEIQKVYDTVKIYDRIPIYVNINVYDTSYVYVERERYIPKEHGYFQKSFYAAHALGRIDGYDYTNSKEAFEQSYAAGYRVFEVDVELTTDGVPVCMHDIESFNRMTGYEGGTELLYEDFLSRKIYGKYTPAGVDFIIEMLMKYDDIYFDLDMVYDASVSLDYLINNPVLGELNTTQRLKLFNRLIFELYFIEDLEKIDDIYELKNIAINSVFLIKDRKKQIELMQKYGLDIFVEHYSVLNDSIVKLYTDSGINVVAWTVDNMVTADYLRKWGVRNVYTNILKPSVREKK